jgi:hypothetical protein
MFNHSVRHRIRRVLNHDNVPKWISPPGLVKPERWLLRRKHFGVYLPFRGIRFPVAIPGGIDHINRLYIATCVSEYFELGIVQATVKRMVFMRSSRISFIEFDDVCVYADTLKPVVGTHLIQIMRVRKLQANERAYSDKRRFAPVRGDCYDSGVTASRLGLTTHVIWHDGTFVQRTPSCTRYLDIVIECSVQTLDDEIHSIESDIGGELSMSLIRMGDDSVYRFLPFYTDNKSWDDYNINMTYGVCQLNYDTVYSTSTKCTNLHLRRGITTFYIDERSRPLCERYIGCDGYLRYQGYGDDVFHQVSQTLSTLIPLISDWAQPRADGGHMY